ncbi:MAG: hypothetical protein M1832_001754 [Thelocarpon impressellum]|nr:MAG: hypothetical protein M1832_001754 [Thelocarpon impressellum]
MSAADPINANPTILNAADLPTRRPHSSRYAPDAGSSSIFSTSIAATSPYPADPFSALPSSTPPVDSDHSEEDDAQVEQIDEQEIFDLISTISDPEHPLSLGSLAVVSLPDIHITPPPPASRSPLSTVTVLITPTITHCSLATVIGLGVRVRLEQALPPRFRVDVRIKEGSHSTGDQVTKQLNDKERVAAALENGTLMAVLNKMLETCK